MKLKTKIEHNFNIEENVMDDLDFNMEIPKIEVKTKTKIINVKKYKIRIDGSTRLF